MPNIIFLLCLLVGLSANAQDSIRRATPPAMPANAPGAAVGNPELTVPPIILPAQPTPQKPRKRTAADSLRLMAQADSIAKQVLGNAARSLYTVKPKPNTVVVPPPPPIQKDTPKVAVAPRVVAPPSVAVRDTPKTDTTPRLSQTNNPFEVVKGAAALDSLMRKNATTAPSPTETLMSPTVYSKNFSFWIVFGMLVLLVIGLQLSRGVTTNVMQSLLNDSHLRLIYREQLGWGNLSYIVMYALFWINLAIFLFLVQLHFGIKTGYSQYTTFTLCLVGTSLIYTIKHFILYVIASVFPIAKEVKLYNFIIIIAGIVIGLILAPINIFLAFSNASLLSTWLIYLGIGAIALVYAVRLLRSLFVSGGLLITNQFHFLLYLCTVEIAPVFVLLKIVLLQMGQK